MGKPWSKRNAERRKKQFAFENRQKQEAEYADRMTCENEHVKISKAEKEKTKKPELPMSLALDDFNDQEE